MKKNLFIPPFFLLILSLNAFSQQARFSVSTDLDLQRSFKKDQRYWAAGQTVDAHWHFSPKEGVYTWIGYYTFGKFRNDVSATAKLPSTVPQSFDYINHAQMRFKHISVGWKHYLKGTFDAETSWNLYGYAGFGLMLGRIINTQSLNIDTSLYNLPVLDGRAHFKRLTLDLGLGWEQPMGADLFFYTEARVWIPTTDYPSPYLFVNSNAPLLASVNFGIRVLFY